MGQFVSNRRFDLILSFRYSPSDGTLARWKLSFEKASELLYAATNGQHQLGKVWVCTGSAGGLNADFWAYKTPIASSANARIWETWRHGKLGSDVRYIPFKIVHELGHYLYALGDEYKETGGAEGSARCLGTGPGPPVSACIMEAGEGRGDRWDATGADPVWIEGEVFQFCTPGIHDRGPAGPFHDDEANDTAQTDRHGESCWDTMKRFYPDLEIPAAIATARAAGVVADAFDWLPLADEKRYVLIADLTPFDPDETQQALEALEQFLVPIVRDAPPNEFFGAVITMNGQTYIGELAFPPRWIPPLGTSGDLFSHLHPGATLDLTGMLRAAGRLINGAGDQAATQIATFVSIGPVDPGADPDGAARILRHHGTRLYTYATNPCPQRSLFRSMAKLTGGKTASFSLTGGGPLTTLRTLLERLYSLTHRKGGLATVRAAIVDTSNASLPGAASESYADGEPS